MPGWLRRRKETGADNAVFSCNVCIGPDDVAPGDLPYGKSFR
jgi:hypothetical protein